MKHVVSSLGVFCSVAALAGVAFAGAATSSTVTAPARSVSGSVGGFPSTPRSIYPGRSGAYVHPVSPYGSNQPFPPPRFWSELISKEFTREALDASHQTREVNLANRASMLIDRGDCAGAEAYLEAMGAPDMAARVPVTCSAKRRGLI